MNRLFALAVAVLPAVAVAQGTAIKPPAPTSKPPMQRLEFDAGRVHGGIKVRPGVPDAGSTVTLEIELSETLDKPHPTFGKRRPIDDAKLRGILVGPPPAKKGGKGTADAHLAVKLADSGVYGLTFTPAEAGVFTLYLRGEAGAVGPIEYQGKLPVGVWPVPAEATVAALPNPEPAATSGDLIHGRALCAAQCKKDVAGAEPKGKTPEWIDSAVGAALSDGRLLQTTVGDAGLDAMQRQDLVLYLRSLHTSVRELIPDAAFVMPHAFTINEYGLTRLSETAKLKLDTAQATGVVFTVWKGEVGPAPVLVDYDDRVARDRLKPKDKLGYVVFFTQPGDKQLREIAFGLGTEPTYPIVKLVARGEGNTRDAGLEKALQGFVGQGKFNDAKSLSKAPKAFADKLLPLYLRAAELATMYRADEREFTAFDDEIAGGAK